MAIYTFTPENRSEGALMTKPSKLFRDVMWFQDELDRVRSGPIRSDRDVANLKEAQANRDKAVSLFGEKLDEMEKQK